MNALERMETFAKTFLCLNEEQKKEAWEALAPMMSEEELTGLKEYVALYHMMSDQGYYRKIMLECLKIYREATFN